MTGSEVKPQTEEEKKEIEDSFKELSPKPNNRNVLNTRVLFQSNCLYKKRFFSNPKKLLQL